MSDTIWVAIIGAVATVFTILSSLKISKDNLNEQRKLINLNAQKERDKEVIKIKQSYYNKFIEALAIKMYYMNNNSQSNSVNEKFCLEFNRLPLYASKNVIHKANEFSQNPTVECLQEIYKLIRDDICNGEYEVFESLGNFNFQCSSETSSNPH